MKAFVRFLGAFALSLLLSFVGGWLLWIALQFLFDGHRTIVGYLYRMYMYPDQHPAQYTAALSVPFAFLTALWTVWGSNKRRSVWIIGIIALSVLIGGVFGGMLYMYHDMQAGFFPAPDRIADQLFWGAKVGLLAGPLIIALSVPANIIAFIIAYSTARYVKKTLGKGTK